uniref:Uncharacterized protein n=1 Tax=Marseillevirus LCMAC101 TaxID=2506602 RepID=A0A481YSX5_9VIRU|nr:MAG: hypothetical protein LCMAC101_04700 [Marseillevirus LCMAC101]
MGIEESRHSGAYNDPETGKDYSWTIDLKEDGSSWYRSSYDNNNKGISGPLPKDMLQKFLEDGKEIEDPVAFRIDFERFYK